VNGKQFKIAFFTKIIARLLKVVATAMLRLIQLAVIYFETQFVGLIYKFAAQSLSCIILATN
jgi:hypothetical protein